MNLFICKTLISIYLKNSRNLQKPPFTNSVSVHFFSTSPNGPRPQRTRSKISLADYLINQHGFPPEAALEASSVRNFVKNTDKSDSILSFLKEIGFSNTHLEKIVKKAPKVLFSNLDHTIKPKIKIFQDLGLPSAHVVHMLSADPWILTRSVDNQIIPSILVLKSVLGSDAAVLKVLKRSGWFLKCDLEKTMIPNIEFLKSRGIADSQILKCVISFPRFFLHKLDRIKNFVERVDEIGFDRKSKKYLPAIRAISSMNMEHWERKLKLFKNLGYSDDHILSIFRSTPQAFAVSERKIGEVTEMLLNRGNVDISYIADNPSLLLCSVEHRLKPRLEVFDMLKSKNLLRKETSLVTICMTCKEKFLEKYVLPYSDELGDLSFLLMVHSQ